MRAPIFFSTVVATIFAASFAGAQDYGAFQSAYVTELEQGGVALALRTGEGGGAHAGFQLTCDGGNTEVAFTDSEYMDQRHDGVAFITYRFDEEDSLRTPMSIEPGGIRAFYNNNQLASDFLNGLRTADILLFRIGDAGLFHRVLLEGSAAPAEEYETSCNDMNDAEQRVLEALVAAMVPWSPLYVVDTNDSVNGRRLTLGINHERNSSSSHLGFACATQYLRFTAMDGRARAGDTLTFSYSFDEAEDKSFTMRWHPMGVAFTEDRAAVDEMLEGFQNAETLDFAMSGSQSILPSTIDLLDEDGSARRFINACRQTYVNY